MLFDPDPDDEARGRRPSARLGGLRDRWPSLLGFALLAVVGLGALWIVITGFRARSHLDDAKDQLANLRSAVAAGDARTTAAVLRAVDADAADAHSLTTGPAWWVAANVPGIGSPARTARIITEQAHLLCDRALSGLPALTSQFTRPQTGRTGRVDLLSLARARPTLDAATTTASRAVQRIRASGDSWLPMVGSARRRVLRAFGRLDDQLIGARRAANVLLPMLGQHGTKRYFIGFLNDAESRPLGGIPGAFAIATVTDGRIRFEHFGSDDDLSGVHAKVRLGAEFDARYGQDRPTQIIQNSDISPDFRDAARIWAGMWLAKSGQRIDGAIAVDPGALSYLLAAVGPANVKNGVRAYSKTVVALTQKTQYTRYPGNSIDERNARKHFLTDIARAVSTKLTGATNIRGVVKALVRSAAERRLMVWSADPAVEQQLIASTWSGALADPRPSTYTGFTVTNAAGSKLDYYLRRTVDYKRFDCRAGATATATLTLTNGAPRKGLPRYVTIRADHPGKGVRPGDNKLIVTYYAGAGAQLRSVTLDGVRQRVHVLPEGNTITASIAVELPAQRSRQLVVSIREPATHAHVGMLRQAGVTPAVVQVEDCG